MGKDYGDLDATKPRPELLTSSEVRVLGDGEVIVAREDLIEAGELAYDHERTEWAFRVIGSTGFPRRVIGIFVIRLDDNGELLTTLE